MSGIRGGADFLLLAKPGLQAIYIDIVPIKTQTGDLAVRSVRLAKVA